MHLAVRTVYGVSVRTGVAERRMLKVTFMGNKHIFTAGVNKFRVYGRPVDEVLYRGF
jgi:hypothetical protein